MNARDRLTHRVRFASFKFRRRSLERYMVFSGPEGRPSEQLRMNTPPMSFGGKNIDSYLIWRKPELSHSPPRSSPLTEEIEVSSAGGDRANHCNPQCGH